LKEGDRRRREGRESREFTSALERKKEKLAPTHKKPGIWWHTVANLHPIHNTT